MSKTILGIDLGTSSVKLLLKKENGQLEKAKAAYTEKTPDGWLCAIKKAAASLDLSGLDSISLSSQVGTYIVNETDVISWDDGVGSEELEAIKNKYPKEVFIREIAMPHPDIISYPIPRLMYIKNHYDDIVSICQPKDYICKALTDSCASDKYSYRGLAHTQTGVYSDFFLNEIGIDKNVLPKLVSPCDIIGKTTADCKNRLGIPVGIPVYTGLNDFFSSIVGMGMNECGDMFDITGTSEHLGLICDSLQADTKMVSGVYFDKYIHYGVTASSGASLDFAINSFGLDGIDIGECLKSNPPIFTPYLNGERAPIFDSRARGTFFGIGSGCTKTDMAYSVLEGVAFSLYHIYESMGCPDFSSITVSGGASKNAVLNTLKAELFNKTVRSLTENDTSALGAVQLAANAMGLGENLNSYAESYEPCGKYRSVLLKRYEIYKGLYSTLKEQFIKFSKI